MINLIECFLLGLIACIFTIGALALVWTAAMITYTYPCWVLIPLGIFTVGVIAKKFIES